MPPCAHGTPVLSHAVATLEPRWQPLSHAPLLSASLSVGITSLSLFLHFLSQALSSFISRNRDDGISSSHNRSSEPSSLFLETSIRHPTDHSSSTYYARRGTLAQPSLSAGEAVASAPAGSSRGKLMRPRRLPCLRVENSSFHYWLIVVSNEQLLPPCRARG